VVTVKQVALALALVVSVPAVVAGAEASTQGVELVEGRTSYGILEYARVQEQQYPPLLGYVPCDVSLFGVFDVNVPEPYRPAFCDPASTVYITAAGAPDPREYGLSATGVSLNPRAGGMTFPPVDEFKYTDAEGRVHYAWRTFTLESAIYDPDSGREFNFVGTADLARLQGASGIRAWVVE